MPLSTVYAVAAMNLIAALEGVGGVPIAILERTGDDTEAFWIRSAEILCKKTGDNFCDSDMRVMTDNTNPLGFMRMIRYRGSRGEIKKVCAVLPPSDTVSPMLTATGASAGNTYSWEDLPSSEAAWVWLMLQNAAHCLDAGGPADDKRADAFATLGSTLIFGDPGFTAPGGKSPARVFSFYRNGDANRWAANLGERALIDTWKAEAVEVAKDRTGCTLAAETSSRMDVDQIRRDPQMLSSDVCIPAGQRGGPRAGRVTDANLWLWMYRSPVGAPPQPWKPLKSFPTMQAAATYIWDQAGKLSQR